MNSLLLNLLVGVSPVGAATLTVQEIGGDYTSIQAAIDAAGPGDTVEVGPGTWAEALEVTGFPITIVGVDGPDATVLDATAIADNALYATADVTLQGFRVHNRFGRGLYIDGARATLSDLLFEDTGGTDQYGAALAAVGGATVDWSDSQVVGGETYYGNVYVAEATINLTGVSFEDTEAALSAAGIAVAAGGVVNLDGCLFETLYSQGDGAAIYLEPGATLYANDTEFYGNLSAYGNGTAIYSDHAVIEMDGGRFELNYSTNYGEGYAGGAVYLYWTPATFRGTLFTDNYAYYGGAIGANRGSAVTLEGAELERNWAYYAGAVYLYDSSTLTDTGSSFADNTGYYGGGAIYAQVYYELDLTDTVFSANTATYSHGGAIYAYNTGNAAYRGVSFEDNYSYYYGAGVWSYYTYGLDTFESCSFTGNYSLYYGGGALAVYYDSDAEISDTIFSGNETGYGHGGAIYQYYSALAVRDSELIANRALEGMGGALYSNYTAFDVVLEDNVLHSNTAYYGGGAIAAYYQYLDLHRNLFHVNDVPEHGFGGAFYARGLYDLSATWNTFSGNNAGYGGVIFSEQGTGLEVWRNNVFQENSAETGGAAIWMDTDAPSMLNNTFINNVAVDEVGNIGLVNARLRFTNNAVVYSSAGVAVHAWDRESADSSTFAYNAFYSITDGLAGGEMTAAAVQGEGTLLEAPAFAAYSADGDPDNDRYVLLRDSPLIDAGDPAVLDIDGSVSDIGAWGGAGVTLEDLDKDGAPGWIDCDDEDPGAHPGAAEVWYDGVNQDCLSGSDYDQDGDGLDAAEYVGQDEEGDCDDEDPAVQVGCEEPPGEDTGGGEDTDSGGDGGVDTAPPDDEPEDTGESVQPGQHTPSDTETSDGKGCSSAGGTGAAGGAGLLALLGLAVVRRRRD
jgi:MYXO-CTERM domain-containing protein